MRQMISGLVAAATVMVASAVPAMACGFGGCAPCGYVSPCAPVVVPSYGCDAGCGGWSFERLADPVTQYYYVNQGPTYTGPGAFAPYPVYRQDAIVTWGHHWHHRPYRHLPRVHYGAGYHYAPYYYHGRRVLRRYY